MIKKISSFLLVAIMLVAVFTPLTVMAASSGTCGDNLSWVLDDSGTLTISGTGDMTEWDAYNESPWPDMKKVIIESGVTSIGNCAFNGCDTLTSIIIPEGVTKIGAAAFSNCNNLASVNLPNSVMCIEEEAFGGCTGLTSINIPDNVTSIGDYAFYMCSSLASISIPYSVTSIGGGAFAHCDSLTSISVDANNLYYCYDNGCIFGKDKTVLYVYLGKIGETSYTIPEGVTSIGDMAFEGCDSFNTINIPNGVTSIGRRAFNYCTGLTSINIPHSVTSIGDSAFAMCSSLKAISIPDSVTSIGWYAFYRCSSLTSISIPNSVTSIGEGVLEFCGSLTDIYYGGKEENWKILTKDAGIPYSATIHFNYVTPGTVIGSALRTNITAMINGHAIPSFNVDGYTYIVAEELKDYGFSVYYDNDTRSLALNRDASKQAVSRSYEKPYVPESEVGIKEHDLVATDIVTYLDNNYVQSYNINGQTIIKFDELGKYGTVSYDNSTRIIGVTIPGLN